MKKTKAKRALAARASFGVRVRLREHARPLFPTVHGGLLVGLCRGYSGLLRILVDGRKQPESWAARFWENEPRRRASSSVEAPAAPLSRGREGKGRA